jgi:hypothetical protein
MLYNLVGYFTAFQYVKHEWKEFVHQKLSDITDETRTITFVFSKKEFDINEREFSKNGHYYDVIKVENINADSIKVVCFDDEYETALVAQYHDSIFEKTPQSDDFKHHSLLIFSKIIKEFLFEKKYEISTPSVFCLKKSNPNFINEAFKSPFIASVSPPPKSILA